MATTFDVRRGDDVIRVRIEEGVATFMVSSTNNAEMIVEALNGAVAAGATRGTLCTTEIVDEQMADMHTMRAQKGITWLGGRVTLLSQRQLGPIFRIDWDLLPTITL
jgi:hypothetical protein